MIVGVGIDVVDIERFGATLDRTPALRKWLFSPAEQHLPLRSLAARFAAKEALAKALGAPIGLSWTDVTVFRAADGRPHLQVEGTVQDEITRLGAVSYTHLGHRSASPAGRIRPRLSAASHGRNHAGRRVGVSVQAGLGLDQHDDHQSLRNRTFCTE